MISRAQIESKVRAISARASMVMEHDSGVLTPLAGAVVGGDVPLLAEIVKMLLDELDFLQTRVADIRSEPPEDSQPQQQSEPSHDQEPVASE